MDVVADKVLVFAKYIKKIYTDNLESKVLKLVNENFCDSIYEQFKHFHLVLSLTFCYVPALCCYTQMLVTEIKDMCLGIFVLYGNCNIKYIESNNQVCTKFWLVNRKGRNYLG
jgi:hypothetical protein